MEESLFFSFTTIKTWVGGWNFKYDRTRTQIAEGSGKPKSIITEEVVQRVNYEWPPAEKVMYVAEIAGILEERIYQILTAIFADYGPKSVRLVRIGTMFGFLQDHSNRLFATVCYYERVLLYTRDKTTIKTEDEQGRANTKKRRKEGHGHCSLGR